jgi:hypothetical protein
MWYSPYRFAWRIIDSSVISFPDIKMIVKISFYHATILNTMAENASILSKAPGSMKS